MNDFSKRTPGNWTAHNHTNSDRGEVRDEHGNWVATVHRRNADNAMGEECVANTELLAAAPWILDELTAAQARIESLELRVADLLTRIALGAHEVSP